ncbi:MAG: cytochrome C [Bradymonadales bacterium]|nr:MAG: cytochrome C [Bradymonadales bacterium]
MSEEQGSDNLAKLLLVGFGLFVVGSLIALHLAYGPRWYQGYAPVQPIPFSHALHAGEYQIPCLYCHPSAEYAAFSAAPGLDTCMSCHNAVALDSPYIQKLTEHYEKQIPIPWVKVHVLPDFVHFNHRAHVAAGVACETCHGPVEEMEVVYQWAALSMGWCMDCHRNDDYLTDSRVALLEEEIELLGGPRPRWHEWIGQKQIHNADVSCSTCHY